MPPTADEIKARLDKAVDQEGNVLNMEAVLEIVAALEKLNMTTEVLEATRIGRTVNNMRKKTSNDELAKRLKKLVKKWQNLVSKQFKNLKSDSPINFISSPNTVNGAVKINELLEKPKARNGKDRPSSCTPDNQPTKSKRRKVTSADNSPLNVKSVPSPKLTLSNSSNSIARKNDTAPVLGKLDPKSDNPSSSYSPKSFQSRVNSPKLSKCYSPKLQNNQPSSPNIKARSQSPKISRMKNSPVNSSPNKQKNSYENDILSTLKESKRLNNKEDATKDDKKQMDTLAKDAIQFADTGTDGINHEGAGKIKKCNLVNAVDSVAKFGENSCRDLSSLNDEHDSIKDNNGMGNNGKNTSNINLASSTVTSKDYIDIEKSKDTRILENRIDQKEIAEVLPQQKDIEKDVKRNSELEINSINPKTFEPIEPENLSVFRKELPDDFIDLDSHSDGINGIFNTNKEEDEQWHDWTETIRQRGDELHILPYVILD